MIHCTRLRSVVADVPKPMALIGARPFLAYILAYPRNAGVTVVILSVGYLWETIRDYFGDSFYEMRLLYSVEDEPRGTGGAIKRAMEKATDQEVIIANGDTFFNAALAKLHLDIDCKLVLSLKKMQGFDRYGSVESDEHGLVTAFREKCHTESGYINGGLHLASRDLFDGYVLNERFSFETFLQSRFRELHAHSVVFDSFFIDIGIPEDYERAQETLKT